MIREYEDKRIYKNLKVVKILAIISLVLSVIGVIAYILRKYLISSSAEFVWTEILFYLIALMLPIMSFLFTIREQRPQDNKLAESKFNNDFSNTLWIALYPVLALIALVCSGGSNGFYYFGYMLLPHLLYIQNIILIRNCVLIKREWKKHPPLWYVKEKKEKEVQEQIDQKIKEAKKEERIQEESERLLDLVGKRFFVKHYFQLKEWSEMDVLDIVQAQYGEKAAQKRIAAGKEIFQRGMERTALRLICDSAENKIDAAAREKAWKILEEEFNEE